MCSPYLGPQKLLETRKKTEPKISFHKHFKETICKSELSRYYCTRTIVNYSDHTLSFSFKMSGVYIFHWKFGHAMSDFKDVHLYLWS